MDRKTAEINQAINIAKIKAKQGKFDEANEIYQKIMSKKIYTSDFLIAYGLFNVGIKKFDLAKQLFFFCLKKYPSKTKSYILLAEIMFLEKNFQEAFKVLSAGKNISKNDPEFAYNISLIYKKYKFHDKALTSIKRALEISPNKILYIILKADILIELLDLKSAEKVLNNLSLDEKNLFYFQKEILFSRVLIEQKKYKKAEKILLKLKTLFINQKIIYLNLSNLYFNTKELKKGIKVLKEGIKIFPKFIPLKFNLAVMYRNSGLLDAAIQTHIQILNIDKFNFNSFYELSTMYSFSDHEILLNNLLNIEIQNLSPTQKVYCCFSKANIFHGKKDYKKSSYFLKIANDEKLKLQPSDLKKKINTGELYRNLKFEKNNKLNIKNNDYQYLFIVGMPRCGSTLLESILSQNSRVCDMGEVPFLEESLNETNDYKNVQEIYQKKINQMNSLDKIFTDKNLFNFLYCPIIYNFFPNAKIIHCKRNPLDNILSIYRTNFLKQSFSSSLKDIADLYIYQTKIMEKYKNDFGSIIYTYDHDKVVQNPEEHIYKLIYWLKWEWNEKYLSPQSNKRNIFTASSAQVRKEINPQSSGYWKKYENLLEPVMESILKTDF